MTGQTLLDTMELLDQELQLQSGEADVTRGLLALNVAQDHFESVLAMNRDVVGDTTGTVATVNGQETTTYPAGLLRLDGLQMLDDNSRPLYDLDPLDETGGHVSARVWPLNLTSPLATAGRPGAYWTNGRNIYWDRLPDTVYTLRWYGLQAASDISAGGTFAYLDIVRLPIATFAVRLMKMGVGDAVMDVDTLAQATFGPVVETLAGFRREGAEGLKYTRSHTT